MIDYGRKMFYKIANALNLKQQPSFSTAEIKMFKLIKQRDKELKTHISVLYKENKK